MYLLRYSLRLFVLLLTLSLGVGGQLFGQYYPVHATIQWPSPQSPHLVDYYSGSRDLYRSVGRPVLVDARTTIGYYHRPLLVDS